MLIKSKYPNIEGYYLKLYITKPWFLATMAVSPAWQDIPGL